MSLYVFMYYSIALLPAGKSAATGASVARDRSGACTTTDGSESNMREALKFGFYQKSVFE